MGFLSQKGRWIKHSWTKEELRAYDNASIAEGDLIQRENFLINKGKEENTYSVIEKCLERNMEAENIADIVDKSVEEILVIIKEIKRRKKVKR